VTPRQFEALLRVREHRRDVVRQALARILSDGQTISGLARRTEAERAEIIEGLKSGSAVGRVDVDRAAALRYHAVRLSAELAGLAKAAAANAERGRQARALLTRADQEVKAVERLEERFEALRRREAERRADREATDRFSAARPAVGAEQEG
jgi:flagellar export protein FliJ